MNDLEGEFYPPELSNPEKSVNPPPLDDLELMFAPNANATDLLHRSNNSHGIPGSKTKQKEREAANEKRIAMLEKTVTARDPKKAPAEQIETEEE